METRASEITDDRRECPCRRRGQLGAEVLLCCGPTRPRQPIPWRGSSDVRNVEGGLAANGKRPWLERLRDDGFFLIDLAPYPVNALSPAERWKVLQEAVPACVARASALCPEGVVVVKADLYGLLARPLVAGGLRLPQDGPISFPTGNWRSDFVRGFNQARLRLSANNA
jgi:hypothetical protein